MELFLEVLAFSAHKHRAQRRKDRHASAYINHPIALAKVLHNEGRVADSITLCAAILHDTVEDTKTKRDELVAAFGKSIADIVMEVTDNKRLHKHTRKRLQVEHAPHLSHRAKLIKLADKIEGSGEALHEVFGGNMSFSSGIIDPDYQKEIHAPPVYYGKYFDALFDKLPLLSPLSAFLALPLITAAISDDLIEMSKDRFPHTRASLDIPTGYAPYDYWKKNFLSHADEDEVKQLYIKTE